MKTSTNNWGLIGHEEVVQYLQKALSVGSLPHALLLVGPEHVGKTTLAKAFVAAILGTDRPEAHPDFSSIERSEDPKTGKMRDTIAIAQVHELRGILSRTSVGARKFALVTGADRLGREAANALLKTLEEPSGDTTLVLTAESEDDILPTVRSRCQILRLKRISRPALATELMAHGVDRETALVSANLSGGCPGLALHLSSDAEERALLLELRAEILALPSLPVAERWAFVEKKIPKRLSFIEAGDVARSILDLASEVFRDGIFFAEGLEEKMIHADASKTIGRLASSMGSQRMVRIIESIETARTRIRSNVSPRSSLEAWTLELES